MLQKDEAQGFLDFCEPEFFRVFCMESDMWTCALQVVREKAMDAHGQASCTHLQLVAASSCQHKHS